MNIDWTQAPPWARFAAKDADGSWYSYAERPTARNDTWGPAMGGFEFFKPRTTPWTQTPTERPTE